MKKNLLNYILGLIIIANTFAKEDSIITKIRDDYQLWQPIIERGLADADKLYNYAWSENYQFDKWTINELNDDTLKLFEEVSILKDKDLGYFVKVGTYSFSGDWYIETANYYDLNGQLYFVFWKMNTFYSEQPLTIEKRLYFDNQGKLINELKSVYKINTKEKIEINFLDKEVNYKVNLRDMDFYQFWKND